MTDKLLGRARRQRRKRWALIRTAGAWTALLRCLAVRNLKAKRAVVAALGEFRETQRRSMRSLQSQRRARVVVVEAELCSVGKLRLEDSLEILKPKHRPPFIGRSCASAASMALSKAAERSRTQIPLAGGEGRLKPSRTNAGRRRARPPRRALPDRKKLLGEEIVGLPGGPGLRVRIGAANALKALKDDSQIPALERMAAASTARRRPVWRERMPSRCARGRVPRRK